MTDEPPSADQNYTNRARSDGLASIAIILLAIALVVFLIIKVV